MKNLYIRRKIAGVIFSLLAIQGSHAQPQKVRVLFIGDTYSASNELPKIVAGMAASVGDTLEYRITAPANHSIRTHVRPYALSPSTALYRLRTERWDYVILQERSVTGAEVEYYDYQEYYFTSFAFVKHMADTVRRYNPCARILFYQNWGWKNGVEERCRLDPRWPHYCSYLAMDSLIRLRTLDQARFNRAAVAPGGAVCRYLRAAHPAIELYQADGFNPSLAGSYAGACSIYTAIFKKKVDGIQFNASLPAPIALTIRAASDKVVYDSIRYWRIGQDELKAGFSYQPLRIQMFRFQNQSVNGQQYKWDFGDGESSTAIDPVHTYRKAGNYTVRLIAMGTSCSDTFYAPISVPDDPDAGSFIVAPNPVTNQLYITSSLFGRDVYLFELYNSQGQVVRKQQATDAPIQLLAVTGLAKGVYILVISSGRRIYQRKVVVQ
ncbi:PKD domain-containing protein [Paraflavitalea sp. CAU 1676]|uniref:PKD domain-containing protein n=1 Tax=Paraflavitalea sp. CAU 1676 TaxID=3032598 RepID=UPI0023DAACC1|nr:PKD domain-containing protein [Paraflavitalea sp. CAU 1676]MDF2189140.1 PKD domain-containing protein [Paraflavitalea sp. CAU 1676]